MALNNCFNSPTCTSMTEHLGGSGSPVEGLSLVPEAFVIGQEYAIVPGSCRSSTDRTARLSLLTSKSSLMRRDSGEFFPKDWSNAGSQELDRP
jgi:hypothetical protein